MIALLRRFAPRPGAPPSVVRMTGLRNAFLGLFLGVFGVLFMLSLDRLTRGAILDVSRPTKLRAVAGIPIVLGLVAMIVGLYRAITGVHPERDGTSLLARTGRLLLSAVIAAAIVFGVVYLVVAVTADGSRRAPGLAP